MKAYLLKVPYWNSPGFFKVEIFCSGHWMNTENHFFNGLVSDPRLYFYRVKLAYIQKIRSSFQLIFTQRLYLQHNNNPIPRKTTILNNNWSMGNWELSFLASRMSRLLYVYGSELGLKCTIYIGIFICCPLLSYSFALFSEPLNH